MPQAKTLFPNDCCRQHTNARRTFHFSMCCMQLRKQDFRCSFLILHVCDYLYTYCINKMYKTLFCTFVCIKAVFRKYPSCVHFGCIAALFPIVNKARSCPVSHISGTHVHMICSRRLQSVSVHARRAWIGGERNSSQLSARARDGKRLVFTVYVVCIAARFRQAHSCGWRRNASE